MSEKTAVERPPKPVPAKARRKTTAASKKTKGNKSPGQTRNLVAVEKTSGIMRRRSIMKSRRAPKTLAAQFSNRTAIKFKPFAHLCMEIIQRFAHDNEPLRAQKAAVRVLQEASETFLISVLQGVDLLAAHAGRQTMMKKDFQTLYRVMMAMQAVQRGSLF